MDIFALIAENRIREAQEQGLFDNLEGVGKPLIQDGSAYVPNDLKMAYKILKNSGYLPKELYERKEIEHLFELIESDSPESEKLSAMRRLEAMIFALGRNGKNIAVCEQQSYYEEVLKRFAVVKKR